MSKPETVTVLVTILPDGRMDTKNASAYLGLSEKTLAMQRSRGEGPRFIKRGRIFYYREDLDAWLNAAGRVTSTAQAAQCAGQRA
ncbi:helix-turn-helix transcriptional regulator [Magnetofaba australis]|uniref:Helix-turn-helix domain-containing protein n=1 Tax=Magnetofaba australis IT-1 TaxID=1434232 RepID=A0A1Y2K1C6_9PROT|nr:helix-turn-helix domain-containing protein [Magnetofaba australis]OSM01798.1 hypothetical protein MAIT1_01836 [Magnetofaba australis IT-1]